MAATRESTRSRFIPYFLRDLRVIQAVGQIIFAVILVAFFSQLIATASAEMRSLGLTPNYTFLQNRAGFDITESPDWYSPSSTYGDALRVGIINTLRIVSVGLVLATLIGIFIGIFLLSGNWLIRTISRVYVEFLRNTPLLVQLFIWYYIVMFSLPQPREALTVPSEGVTFITLRLVTYLLLYLLLRRSLRGLAPDTPRRAIFMTGLAVFAVVTEAAFYLYHNQPAWAGTYGSADLSSGPFLLYALASALALAAASFAPPLVRPYLLGAAAGQALAGLLFYFGTTPNAALRVEQYPVLYLSIRGIAFPELLTTARLTGWLAFVTLGILTAGAIWIYAGRITETTGRAIPRARYALLALVILTLAGWIVVGMEPLPDTVPVAVGDSVEMVSLATAQRDGLLNRQQELLYSSQPLMIKMPQQNRLGRFTTGTEISPEYVALLLGLVVYTSAFIAEIVRAGIQAVPYGQIEAARATGLTQSQTLSLIVLPQALRVIIPPLGNQYLNLSKNSSLAIAIGYFDVFNTSTTIMNQSGQSVTGITIIMGIYLTMSLTISAVMNWVNGRFQLVTR
jgi:His/Glu/Gln/Arg/opine family amino acid ABC transporter permease subunit